MKDHLLADLETNKRQHERPVFHKIGFDHASIYLTKSYYYEAGIPVTGRNSHGNYRLFSWADLRAKAFLGFELGQMSPALGRAKVIGSFTPLDDDIQNVKYTSDDGKFFYKSARDELSEHRRPVISSRINVEHFMAMKEIIPTGAQGKAIYGEGNFIIDGYAGTGKSTTVLQKLKLLQLQNNVESSQIAIVVKNTGVVERFQELLNIIGIQDISILTTTDFINTQYCRANSLTNKCLADIYDYSQCVFNAFEDVCNIKNSTSFGYELNLHSYNTLIESVPNNVFREKLDSFLNQCQKLLTQKIEKDKSFESQKNDITKNANHLTKQLTERKLLEKQKTLGNRMLGALRLTSKKFELTINEQLTIRDYVNKDKKTKEIALAKAKDEFQKNFAISNNSLENLKIKLMKNLLENARLETNQINQHIQTLYFDKCFKIKAKFHTIIIDEAQDVSGKNIELIRLLADNTILTGDELQRENPDGIGGWVNLLIEDAFKIENKLNLFELRHNFRQTYELGVTSYNYRQLLLGRELVNTRSEYFENQIGFEMPALKHISDLEQFFLLVRDRVSYIKKTFSQPFPLVVLYETADQFDKFSKTLENKVSYSIENNDYCNTDVLFINIKDIAGREFPVVIAPINFSTQPSTLYIMLSRPKFNLTLFTKNLTMVDKYILALCDANYINKVV